MSVIEKSVAQVNMSLLSSPLNSDDAAKKAKSSLPAVTSEVSKKTNVVAQRIEKEEEAHQDTVEKPLQTKRKVKKIIIEEDEPQAAAESESSEKPLQEQPEVVKEGEDVDLMARKANQKVTKAESESSEKPLQAQPEVVKEGEDVDLTARKANQKVTKDIAKRIIELAPKIKKGEISREKAAKESGISVGTLRSKLIDLENGKDLVTKNKFKKTTEDKVEKIKALAPKIDNNEISVEKAAAQCGISEHTLRAKLKALKEGKNITKHKPIQRVNDEIANKIKDLAPKIERGEVKHEDAAKECGISIGTLKLKLKDLKEGKDLVKKKTNQKTDETVEKIKAFAPKIEKKEVTLEEAAKKCGITTDTLKKRLKEIKEGKQVTATKPRQLMTKELAKKIEALAAKMEKGEILVKDAAAECEMNVATFRDKLKVLKEGGDLTKAKTRQLMTPETIKKIKSVAPKIEKGKMTIDEAAVECGVSLHTFREKLKVLKEGGDLTKKRPRTKATEEVVEKAKPAAQKKVTKDKSEKPVKKV